jgi:hypothetical protein
MMADTDPTVDAFKIFNQPDRLRYDPHIVLLNQPEILITAYL